MACAICKIRRPRRFCPGVHGDICTVCCGTEREITVSCPLDCVYLQEARKHEKAPDFDPDHFPHNDVRVTEHFLRDHETLLVYLARQLLRAGLETHGAVDNDVREALDALTRTYRTLQSGLIYENRPANPLAANICSVVQESLKELREQEAREMETARTRDADVLGILVFLQRLELSRNNGRRLGRAFLDFLRSHFPETEAAPVPATSSLILP
jgi:hypothetical protein